MRRTSVRAAGIGTRTVPSEDTPGPRQLDTAMRGLSQAANKGRLWLAIAAVGVLVPGQTRRAACRGIATLTVTSAVANGVLKPLIRRRRPDAELTPAIRRLTREPVTTSFPSGHAASAAAFATGVAMENTALGAAVTPLAAAVAYSRVHVGVHHVGDVVAGAVLGAGVALAGRRWWPVHPRIPARIRHGAPAPALPRGEGMLVVVNPASGRPGSPREEILGLLPQAEVVELDADVDIEAVLASRRGVVRALGVAGGDGTVAAAAAVAVAHRLPLAIFPAGTLNHFARDVGLEGFDDVRTAVEAGQAVAVDIATADGRTFLNTASIGGYPDLVRRREALEHRWGKWLAMALAAGQVLHAHQPLRVALDGEPVSVWLVFVGNGCYVPRGTFPAWRPRLDDGYLDVQYLSAEGRFSRTRAVLAILTGTGERSRVHVSRTLRTLKLEALGEEVGLACDGEAVGKVSSCAFGKLPGALAVYRPTLPAPASSPDRRSVA
ncbi:phosphatase PAP2 family protein [Phytoactinopolyspora alkaliphila]|uniref:Phosphatase PAP2 family protein n=1 Tax=Phytoactinopolyspora alkaliphila TaxID=1783498 RepID=A0A6N9YFZ1_9ACTN|nr:phosphatase PAP2 family protein [Phytoactinopolyspora alkaliphila]NED93835.1 phosphatase PAP2 family protein [Phytoactinopolyspora alkaliphila]